ncbi:MAG TPA: PAS domain-containing protein [Segetibacter sp.]
MSHLFNTRQLNAEHNHTKLFSQAPAPIAIYRGRELRYVLVNEAYSKLFNHREILGKTLREAFPELEGQGYYEILEGVFDTGVPFYGNETPALIDIDNTGVLTTRYYNLVYTPYKDDDGNIDGVMAFGHDVTDQVEARQKERESDLRFRNIVEQSSDPILILKGEELVLDVANDALFKLWNVGKESLGKSFLEILPEMRGQGFYELLLDVFRNGKTHYGFETPAHFKRSNGQTETRYFNFSYQPYHEADGTISGVLVLATDVTEQVLAKQKYEQSEHNFRTMIVQAPVAMCLLKGPEHIVELANEYMYELWGKSENEMSGKPIFQGLPEAKGQGFEKLLQDVYINGNRFIANERPVQLPRNGKIETTYINFVYEPYREGDQSISGVIAVATEVTEQVIARQHVEYAEESARLAIESAQLGTYDLSFSTKEISASPRVYEIWGLQTGENNIDVFSSFIAPDDLPVRNKAHQDALKTGKLAYEARLKRPDGSIRWIKANGTVLYDTAGTPERLIGVIQDITEQKLFAEELSKNVEERTKDLREANQQLERSNEELEQFAYIASHDLQEPLRKIQLFNSLLLDQPELRETAKKYIDKVNASATRMAGLIRDLLDYSHLAQKSLQFERTDLNEILKNVLSDYEVLINQKQASIKVNSLPTVEAIPLQMNQLFFNLIGNALKFTKRNVAPVINITAKDLEEERKATFKALDANKTYCEISITDNGIGFNQEYADKIFTIFQKLNEKSMYGGYGIGLALCRKIVDNHSGIIYAEGNPTEGATFVFVIPYNQYQN